MNDLTHAKLFWKYGPFTPDMLFLTYQDFILTAYSHGDGRTSIPPGQEYKCIGRMLDGTALSYKRYNHYHHWEEWAE